ncbi:MAG TPA: hypothetical protein VN699_20320 [Pirellulales bacterium]|nr:hypothetical protein [Pirellulales bacterium]
MATTQSATDGRSTPTAAAADRLWLAAFLLLAFLIGCVEIEDPDIWWHLRTGQLIFERGEIPRHDWFTYTNPESAWIDLHWGFQLVAAGLWSLGGAAALVLVKSLLGAATFAVSLGASRGDATWRRTVGCWLPSLLIFSGRNQVRPEMFSFLFLAITLAIIARVRERPRLAWSLPVVQVLWVNSHGLFILGLVAWGCFLADAIVRRLRSDRRRAPQAPRDDFRLWVGVTLGMAIAALANPYGYRGALFPFTLLQRIQGADRGFYRQFAGEFDGLGEFIGAHGLLASLANVTICMTLVLFALGVASFFRLWQRRKFDLYRPLLFAAFAYLAWQSSRNSALFAIAGGMVVARNFAELRDVRSGTTDQRRFHFGAVVLAACLGLLIAAMPTDLFWTLARSESPRRFGFGETPNLFAHESARFLGREGMPQNVFAVDQGEAAVYIFHDGPERRVFADGRLEVNTRMVLERYQRIRMQMVRRDPSLLESLGRDVPRDSKGRREAPALLIDVGAQEWTGVAADSRFRLVHFDGVALVFLTVEQAEKLRLPAIAIDNEVLALARLRAWNRRVEND